MAKTTVVVRTMTIQPFVRVCEPCRRTSLTMIYCLSISFNVREKGKKRTKAIFMVIVKGQCGVEAVRDTVIR